MKAAFCLDLVGSLAYCDIPLYRIERLSRFLRDWCPSGGHTPHMTTLRKIWMPRAFAGHLQDLARILAGQRIWIGFDETTDKRNWQVLQIMVGSKDEVFTIAVRKMTDVNNATVARQVVLAMARLNLTFNNVYAVVSDSASYCRKSVEETLLPLCAEDAVHVRCISHILALIADPFGSESLQSFVSCFQGVITLVTCQILFFPSSQAASIINLVDRGGLRPGSDNTYHHKNAATRASGENSGGARCMTPCVITPTRFMRTLGSSAKRVTRPTFRTCSPWLATKRPWMPYFVT